MDIFNENNIWVKRPGTGPIKAEDFEKVLGKVALRDIPIDTHIDWKDFND